MTGTYQTTEIVKQREKSIEERQDFGTRKEVMDIMAEMRHTYPSDVQKGTIE